MNALTVNEQVLAILSKAHALVEIRDESGHVVGFYAPNAIPGASARVEALAHVDLEEIKRRKEDKNKCAPSSEVFARLKALEEEVNRRENAGEQPFSTQQGVDFVRSLREATDR